VPLSSDPAKREVQLANLQRGSEDGAMKRALSHGGYAQLAQEQLDEKTRQIMDALAADAPLRAADGGLPAHDSAIVALLADCMCRLDSLRADITAHGIFHQRGRRKGQVRPAVELERQLRRDAAGYLDQLGMTPKSRSALGLDLARTFDLAKAMSSGDEDALRAAGVIDGGTG
jgi:phage terminase small subunit